MTARRRESVTIRTKSNDRQRERYATDQAYRERKRVIARQVYQTSAPRDSDKRNARQRLRYATDPTYREHVNAKRARNRRLNPHPYRASAWRSKLKAHYGLSPGDVAAMLERQGGVCASCGLPPDKRRLSIDHDHATGKVRGLVHTLCNILISHVEERRRVVLAAFEYLEFWSAKKENAS